MGAECGKVRLLKELPCDQPDKKQGEVRGGVMFVTYSTLTSSSKGTSAMEQLVQWCGQDFDGLLVFDECHKAKNLVPGPGRQPTRTGAHVCELQERLPQARVVYCSATGASEPRNMGYMTRLGLWGTGTRFSDFGTFIGTLEKKGVRALERVAVGMKALGMYLCRTLSFKGAEFSIHEVQLDADTETYQLSH